jgi:tetratricopeptide (TPR) repeat protein
MACSAPNPGAPFRVLLAVGLLALAAAGCGKEAGGEPAPRSSPAPSAKPAARSTAIALPGAGSRQLDADRDPGLHQVAAALEKGDLARARELLLAVSARPERPDASLLRVRLLAQEGDQVGAVRELEAARQAFPDQGSVFATAAEIHAAAGRLGSAETEIRNGLATAGTTPELERARGVLLLCKPGGAKAGLEHLLAALRVDPGLPFCARPLAQAHLLLGNAAMARKDPATAIAEARAGLLLEPADRDTRQLLADALVSVGQFDESLAIYEQLLAEGADLRSSLALYYQRAATAALIEERRDLAVERYARARELQLSDTDLGFGLRVLTEASEAELTRGLDAYDKSDLAAAEEAFRKAARYAPRSVEAHNHLGVVLFKRDDFAGAAAEWGTVLREAREQKLDLPEPVHLNLARALHQAGRVGEIRAVLEGWLAEHPSGEWVAQTQDMLARLSTEELARQAAAKQD